MDSNRKISKRNNSKYSLITNAITVELKQYNVYLYILMVQFSV